MKIALLTACFSQTVRRLRDEEDGLALTEYLLLLGLLVGGVIGAITMFGGALTGGWTEWALWADTNLNVTVDDSEPEATP